jgi:hypothetical protein
MTVWIVIAVAGVLGVLVAILLIDAALEWNDRRRYGDACTAYNRCAECAAEPPSRLDRWDGAL